MSAYIMSLLPFSDIGLFELSDDGEKERQGVSKKSCNIPKVFIVLEMTFSQLKRTSTFPAPKIEGILETTFRTRIGFK